MKILWITKDLYIRRNEGELVLVLSKEEVNRLETGEDVCVAGIMIKGGSKYIVGYKEEGEAT